jgi:Na+/proline symporter
LGLLSFQLFFNVVDMQNWQQIAANEDMAESSYGDLSWSMVRASLYLYWFPALGGVLIGTALRAYPGTLTDTTLFNAVFASLAPNLPDALRGLLIGFIVLGLIATSLSTFDSLLMSALQTIRYDLFGRERLSEIRSGFDDSGQKERAFVSLSRKLLIPIAVSMIVAFYYLYTAYPGQILNFQAVMYAAPLMLIAPILLALFTQSESRSRHSFAVSLSLSLGLLTLFGMFRAFSAEGASAWEKEWMPNLMPLTALAFTAAGIVLSALYWKARGR